MKRRLMVAPIAAVLVAVMSVSAYAGSEVGDQAPELKPSGWLNNKGPVSWERMKGKLILIEKWATW